MPATPQVRIFPSEEELFRGAAEKFCELGEAAIRKRGCYSVALSGGSTPRSLHSQLTTSFSKRLPWEKVFFFWGDERHVPPDFPESNFRMAKETLLSKLPIPQQNIFRMRGELPDANEAAAQYEQSLRDFFKPSASEFPRLDFTLLGMGPDGHTASLFPGTTGLQERQRWVIGNWVPQKDTWRITLTYPAINNSRVVLFMVNGETKADMAQRVLKDPSANFPCQAIRPADGELLWYLDKGAGAKL
jgi:6-phosphogluconolactonase